MSGANFEDQSSHAKITQEKVLKVLNKMKKVITSEKILTEAETRLRELANSIKNLPFKSD